MGLMEDLVAAVRTAPGLLGKRDLQVVKRLGVDGDDAAAVPHGDGYLIVCGEAMSPPFLKAGKLLVAQVANILFYLGPRLKLAPRDEAGRLWLHQLQLTVTDFVKEIHDTHHPVASGLYYEDQKPEAKRYADNFIDERAPKYLGYFETVLRKSGGPYLAGRKATYVDLSVFQLIEGLRYAFPQAMSGIERKVSGLVTVRDKVAMRPGVKAYLASPRRIAFNEMGIFRHYPELDR